VGTYRLWPSTNGAGTDSANSPISLGTEIVLSATGWVTALHMWRATLSEVGPVTGAVYAVATATQVPGTAVTYTLSGTGWQTATLAVPVQLAASTRYIVVVHHTDRYAGTASYWTSGPGGAGITNGILTAPPNSAVTTAPAGQGRYTEAGTIQAPTSTFSGGGYWADLSVTDVNPGGVSGTGSLTATGAIASTGTRRTAGTATLGGTLTAATTGTRRATGAAATTATATPIIAGRKTLTAAITLDSGGTLTTSGAKRGQGQAVLPGGGTAVANGGGGHIGGATLAAVATLATTGIPPRSGTATLMAALGATTTGTAMRHGTAALTATAVLTGGQADAVPTARRIKVGAPRTRWSVGPGTT